MSQEIIEKLREISNIEILFSINILEDLKEPIHRRFENEEIDKKLEKAIYHLHRAMDNIDYILYIIKHNYPENSA